MSDSIQGISRAGGELSQRTERQVDSLGVLRRHASDLIERSGPGWYRHATSALPVQTHARLLHYDYLYRQVLTVPGMILEFGVQWGATLAQLIALRAIYEPFNTSRKVVGFDTFSGFPSVSDLDGPLARVGDYSSEPGFRQKLESMLAALEAQSPCSEQRRFELVEGDVCATLDPWLSRNPHGIVSMAIFDMDVHAPTAHAIQHLIPRLTKGSLLVFDELCHPGFPGETVAVREVLGLDKVRLRRSSLQPYCAWCVWGE
jgi:hypothetical protein